MAVPSRRRKRPNFVFESEAWADGHAQVAGLDEVGRGPLAGPVVAAAVILPPKYRHRDLNDSKVLTPERRQKVAEHLRQTEGVIWAIGEASVGEIETLNILRASLLAMRRALEVLAVRPDFLLIDGKVPLRCGFAERTVVGGDGRCASIAAASVLAKVHRDELMVQLDALYPGYGLAQHKGYATERHRAALERLGPCPIHRPSFCSRGPAAGPMLWDDSGDREVR